MKIKFVKEVNKDNISCSEKPFPRIVKDIKGREYTYVGSINKDRHFGWRTLQTLKVIGLGCLIIPLIVPKLRRNLGRKLSEISLGKEEIRYYIPSKFLKTQKNHEYTLEAFDSMLKRTFQERLVYSYTMHKPASAVRPERREIQQGAIFGRVKFEKTKRLFTLSFDENSDPAIEVQKIVNEMKSTFSLRKGECKKIKLFSITEDRNGNWFAQSIVHTPNRQGAMCSDDKTTVESKFENILQKGFKDPGNLEF